MLVKIEHLVSPFPLKRINAILSYYFVLFLLLGSSLILSGEMRAKIRRWTFSLFGVRLEWVSGHLGLVGTPIIALFSAF
eukprot:UN16556